MKFKRPIYRILFYAAWIAVLGGVITLLVAANNKADERTCQGVAVSINNGGDKIYVEKEDVLKRILKAAGGKVVNKNVASINLASLEKTLERNPWIRDAELYFDTKDVLHVAIAERVPVARVFTTAGATFYIDTAGYQMPLLETYSAKLPVVTGFTAAKKRNSADSAHLQEIKGVIQAISQDPFWNAQVGQIDITPDRKFELIPTIGSHVIRLGSGFNVEEKLARLMVFYKQVLPTAGFAKYAALDVQFNGQVVAVKKGPTSVVDSIQLQRNIEELMQKKAAEQEPDDVLQTSITKKTPLSNGDFDITPEEKDTVAVKPVIEKKSVPENAVSEKKMVTVQKPVPAVQKPTPKKTVQQQSKPVVKPKEEKKSASKPKAVMQKKVENDY